MAKELEQRGRLRAQPADTPVRERDERIGAVGLQEHPPRRRAPCEGAERGEGAALGIGRAREERDERRHGPCRQQRPALWFVRARDSAQQSGRMPVRQRGALCAEHGDHVAQAAWLAQGGEDAGVVLASEFDEHRRSRLLRRLDGRRRRRRQHGWRGSHCLLAARGIGQWRRRGRGGGWDPFEHAQQGREATCLEESRRRTSRSDQEAQQPRSLRAHLWGERAPW